MSVHSLWAEAAVSPFHSGGRNSSLPDFARNSANDFSALLSLPLDGLASISSTLERAELLSSSSSPPTIGVVTSGRKSFQLISPVALDKGEVCFRTRCVLDSPVLVI